MAAARPSSSDDEGACTRGGAVRLYVCLCDATLRDCEEEVCGPSVAALSHCPAKTCQQRDQSRLLRREGAGSF